MRNAWWTTQRWIPGVALMGASLIAAAGDWQSERYPWDRRAFFCQLEKNATTELCKARDWPDYDTSRVRLRDLLESGRYALLDRALKELLANGEPFPDGDSRARAVEQTLNELLRDHAQAATIGVDALDLWRAAVPASDFVRYAEILQAYRDIWAYRGASGATALPESRELLNRRVRNVEQALLESPPSLKETVIWHTLLMEVSFELRPATVKPMDLFAAAAKRWPRDDRVYAVVLHHLLPERGGNWSKVETFIDHVSQQTAATEGRSMYARLYHNINGHVLERKTLMDWGKMKVGFQDWLDRYPSMQVKNLYASYACFARDKDAFVKAIGRLTKDEIAPPMWLMGHSYEACARWAGV